MKIKYFAARLLAPCCWFLFFGMASQAAHKRVNPHHDELPPTKRVKTGLKVFAPQTIKSFKELDLTTLKAKQGTTVVFFDLDSTLVRRKQDHKSKSFLF